jgi:DMSO/TMAO reductase YedYZ molybdopterin-dependent catalytic subunit
VTSWSATYRVGRARTDAAACTSSASFVQGRCSPRRLRYRPGMHRRTFLASAAALACHPDPATLGGLTCADGLPGTRVRTRPFVDELERTLPVGVVYGDGLDARQLVDLAALTEDALVTPADAFYLRTAAPTDLAGLDAIAVDGLVEAPATVAIADLDPVPMGVFQFECSGNGIGGSFGLMSAGDFAGVPLAEVLDRVVPTSDAVAVRITGRDEHPPSDHSEPGASWVYRLDELAEAWLVTHQDGAPLLPDHGAPVRLLVPGWYGCTNLKWVERITFVDADEPATAQMQEFASRTHQDGVPALARDYAPAEIECSATPVRVEEWEVDGRAVFRVIGVVWGGKALPTALHLWMDDEDLGPVEMCGDRDVRTWGLWQALLPDRARGTVTLHLHAEGVPDRRLDERYYDREVDLG